MSIIRTEGFDYLPLFTNPSSATMPAVYGALGFYDWFIGFVPTIRNTDAPFGYGKFMRVGDLTIGSGIGLVLPPGPFPKLYHGLHARTLPGSAMTRGGDIQFISAVPDIVRITVELADYGVLKVYRGENSPANLLGASAAGSYPEHQWFHLEIGVESQSSPSIPDGKVTVRVNTVPVVSLIDQAIGQFTLDAVKYLQVNQSGMDIDNLYFDDSEFLGQVRCQWLPNDGPGQFTTWTSFNGVMANWQAASNINVDDSQYVYTFVTGVGNFDTYNVASLITAAEVFAVSVKGAYRQTDATQRFVQNVIRSGTTVQDGALTPANPQYRFVIDVFSVDPNTGSAWTAAAVNLLQVGPKLGA